MVREVLLDALEAFPKYDLESAEGTKKATKDIEAKIGEVATIDLRAHYYLFSEKRLYVTKVHNYFHISSIESNSVEVVHFVYTCYLCYIAIHSSHTSVGAECWSRLIPRQPRVPRVHLPPPGILNRRTLCLPKSGYSP